MSPQPLILYGFILMAIALAGCSGGDSTTTPEAEAAAEESSDTAETEAAATPAGAPANPPAPTEVPEPSVPPEPTTAPTPEPIFTRVKLPADAVSEPVMRTWAFSPPDANFDWLGTGHEYMADNGVSVPVTWSFGEDNEITPAYLPLPAGSDIALGRQVDIVAGRQVVAGTAVQDQISRTVLWTRTSESDDWQLVEGVSLGLPQGEADSRPIGLAGNETWGMLTVQFDSPTEVDDDGEPVQTRQHLTTLDGETWQQLTLDIDPTWFIGLYVDGSQGLITAVSPDHESPAAVIATSSDAGITWETHDVIIEAAGESTDVLIGSALWNDGAWLVHGGIGPSADTSPVRYLLTGDVWQPEPLNLTWPDQDASTAHDVEAIARLDDTTLMAILETTEDDVALFSTDDGTSWQVQPFDLSRLANSADVIQLVADPDRDRVLALRGFDPPMWITTRGAALIGAPDMTRSRVSRGGIIELDGSFVMFTTPVDGETQTDNWVSSNGAEWSAINTVGNHLADQAVALDGVAFWSWGRNEEGFPMAKLISDQHKSDIDLPSLFGVATASSLTIPRIGQSGDRYLFTTSVTSDAGNQLIVSFFNGGESESAEVYTSPGAGERMPTAVCPALESGEIIMGLRGRDEIGSTIEVWKDEAQPLQGTGQAQGDLTDVRLEDCTWFDAGLILAGGRCVDDNDDDGVQIEECSPMSWISTDGFWWTEHHLMDLFNDDVGWLSALAVVDGGVLAIGTEEDDNSLWLITPTEVAEVPLDDVFTLNTVDVREVVTIDNMVVIASRTELFAGNLDYLIERTLATAAADGLQPINPPTPPAAPERVSAPAAVLISGSASSAAPAAPAAPPAAPAPTPVPQAPAPVAQPTPAPATPVPATPVPATPDGDGDGVIISSTLTCSTVTDEDGNVISETCERGG